MESRTRRRTPTSTAAPWANGFDENVEFFDLVYLDRDEVSQGSHFADIEPSLWLMAGGVGILAKADEDEAVFPGIGLQLRRAV